jgi:hypothetical protein
VDSHLKSMIETRQEALQRDTLATLKMINSLQATGPADSQDTQSHLDSKVAEATSGNDKV